MHEHEHLLEHPEKWRERYGDRTCPRRITSERLSLVDAQRVGQRLDVRYKVARASA